MTGNELIRKVKQLGRRRGIAVEFIPRRGKGSHGTLFFGSNFTIVCNLKSELRRGTMHGILNQLGLKLEDL